MKKSKKPTASKDVKRTKKKHAGAKRVGSKTTCEGTAEECTKEESASQMGAVSGEKTVGGKDIQRDLALAFTKATLQKGVQGIRTEFAKNPRSITPEMMEKMKVFTANPTKNRYKDVGCWDSTRVQLRGMPDSEDYIHASYVSTPSSPKRFICAQAPIDITCAEYWRMIMQDQVSIILMLCNFLEKGAKKCAEYYPMTTGESKTFETFTIKKTNEEFFSFIHKTSTQVKVSYLTVSDGTTELNCEHYHWLDWPDRGVPPADHAPLLLLNKLQASKQPIVVHCSAGIGRTGSIVLIQTIVEMLQYSQPFDNMEDLLLKLREQRMNSVQTDHQYLYVHQVMLEYFKSRGFYDNSINKVFDKFSADYKKYVIT